ncbi:MULTISPECIES: MFS transporter [Prauserella salsuginis group]|uniref:MFS transporter n=1 Tax=Prauserella salsuginis TaxID=387889 RepID=A0ABW6FZU2_9PSEU|nr:MULTISPECIES: MFS transporter [Prauserella salsuginis group]
MSIVAGGLTVATVVGLPAGTWIGQHLGWRGAFWAVAVLSSVGAAAIIAAVPPLRPENPPSLRNELRGLRPPRLWLSYAMTAVATTALLGTFSYLAAMLIETTGLDSTWVPAVLFGYGFGALIGIAIGGKTADRHPRAVLGIGFTGLLMASLLLALTAHHVGTTVVLVVALGVLGFGTNPALNSRFMTIAPRRAHARRLGKRRRVQRRHHPRSLDRWPRTRGRSRLPGRPGRRSRGRRARTPAVGLGPHTPSPRRPAEAHRRSGAERGALAA